MPKRMHWVANVGLRIWLAASVAAGCGDLLWSQAAPASDHERTLTAQSFAGYNDALAREADTLIAAPTLDIPATTDEIDGHRAAASINLGEKEVQRSEFLGKGRRSLAEVRLEMLRPIIDPILQRHGVPTDIAAALILIESGGNAAALSAKGARGLWQLMPGTARRYGLRVDDSRDERLDLSRASDAAAQYLHDLYLRFGDWRLALAGYNAGEASVSAAIQSARSENFDQLTRLQLLPLETRNYVPRVLSAAVLFGHTLRFDRGSHLVRGEIVFAVMSQ